MNSKLIIFVFLLHSGITHAQETIAVYMSSKSTIEPIKYIHTDFASNGNKARMFLQNSPRDGQLDITLPSGKTITYYLNEERTKEAQQVTIGATK